MGVRARCAVCLTHNNQQPRPAPQCFESQPLAMNVEWGNLNPVLHPFAVSDHGGIFGGDIVYVFANIPAAQRDFMDVTLRLVGAKVSTRTHTPSHRV
jgi:hypothetical protein